MKTTLAWVALGVFALPAAADVTKDDLKKLALAGLSDEVVLAFIRANCPVQRLSADDIVELKQAGLGDTALAAVVGGPAPVVERRVVVVPRETYVEPPSYYLYASTYSSCESWFPGIYASFGSCAAMMAGKSSPDLTLRGANSVMSRSPDHSSLCLIRSQLGFADFSPPREYPRVRTRTQDPFSL